MVNIWTPLQNDVKINKHSINIPYPCNVVPIIIINLRHIIQQLNLKLDSF